MRPFVNSPSSPEQAADCSGPCCSDGEQLPLLNPTPTASASSRTGAAMWPTPQCMDAISMTRPVTYKANSPRIVSNQGVDGMAGLRDVVAHVSLSTPTSAPSTPPPGVAGSTSSRGAFPASRTVRPGNGSVVWTPETSGLTPFAYCESVTLPSGSSRTYPVSSQAEMLTESPCSAASLATYPKRGSMRNGACWERMMSVPRIDASGCGYWPSATATTRECTPGQWEQRRADQGVTLHSTYLQDAVKYQAEERSNYPTPRVPDLRTVVARGQSTPQTWGTPTSRDHKDTGTMENVPENALLGRQVLNRATWSSPRHSDWKGARTRTACTAHRVEVGQQNLAEDVIEKTQTNGSLNPTWVEWLMGWPRGWTDCEHSATDRCLSRWLRRGRSWLALLGYLEGADE